MTRILRKQTNTLIYLFVKCLQLKQNYSNVYQLKLNSIVKKQSIFSLSWYSTDYSYLLSQFYTRGNIQHAKYSLGGLAAFPQEAWPTALPLLSPYRLAALLSLSHALFHVPAKRLVWRVGRLSLSPVNRRYKLFTYYQLNYQTIIKHIELWANC